MERAQNKPFKRRIMRFEAKVADNAFIIGKPSRDILWPHGAVITAITRADNNRRAMDNDGEKKFYLIKWRIGDREYTNHYFTNAIDIGYAAYIRDMAKCGYDNFSDK